MLVLTRKVGECILIGDDICVKLISISGGTVRLGIVAPPDVRIMRDEVAERLNAQHAAKIASQRNDSAK